jgi:hypothetical protein
MSNSSTTTNITTDTDNDNNSSNTVPSTTIDFTSDVDIDRLSLILSRLQNRDLPYNAYAFSEDRAKGQGLQDICNMLSTRAYVIDMVSGETAEHISGNSFRFRFPENSGVGSASEIGGEDVFNRYFRYV